VVLSEGIASHPSQADASKKLKNAENVINIKKKDDVAGDFTTWYGL
jgi:hypothetical protein